MFQELGPDARALLGVVAFFPQGVDENNLDWLFPTISNRAYVFDKFCILSLTYRSNGFITMLAPLRDYLSPKDPKSSPLLCAIKEHYFTRMSVELDPNEPGFGDARWITSEDVNVEHLLDIFTSIDANSDSVWDACVNFMDHLYWHKKRLVVPGPRIEGLPDDHPSKSKCLFGLSRLFDSVGNWMECKRVLSCALGLWREQGDGFWVATVLADLSDTNRWMNLYKEGIELAKEALEIFERLGIAVGQAECLDSLARSFLQDKQLDAAEETGSRAIDLFLEEGDQFQVCQSHRLLGHIYYSKDEEEKAIYHYEAALGIASSFNWHDQLFWVHHALAKLFSDQDKFDNAHAHVELAKSHTVDNAYAYFLGRIMELQAGFWHRQHQFEEARSEVLGAAEVYEKLGATRDLEDCRELLQRIEQEMKTRLSDISTVSPSKMCYFLRLTTLYPLRLNTASRVSGQMSSSSSPCSPLFLKLRSLLPLHFEPFSPIPVVSVYHSVFLPSHVVDLHPMLSSFRFLCMPSTVSVSDLRTFDIDI